MAEATEWFDEWANRLAYDIDHGNKHAVMQEIAQAITDEVLGQGHYMRSQGLPDYVIEEEP